MTSIILQIIEAIGSITGMVGGVAALWLVIIQRSKNDKDRDDARR